MAKAVDIPGVGVTEFPNEMSDDEIAAVIQKEAPPAPEPPPAKSASPPVAEPAPSLASLVPPRVVPQGLEDAAAEDAAKNAPPVSAPEPQKAPGFGDYMTGFARAAQAGDREAMADLAKRGRDALAATGAKPETLSAYDNWTGKTGDVSGNPDAAIAQHVGDVATHPVDKLLYPLAMGAKSGLTLGLEPKVSAAIHALPKWLVGQPIALNPDEYAAAVAGKNGYAERYSAIRDAIQKKYDDAREANPGAFTVGQVGSSLALPLPGAAARNASTAWKVAKPSLVGAGVGGLAGFGQAKGDVGEVAKGTLEGAGLGGGIGLAAGALPEILRGLGRGAPRAANKSLGADRSVMKNVSNPTAVGQEALDKGITLSNPEKAVRQAEDLMGQAGQRMRAVKSGNAKVPYEDVYADVKNQVIDPLRDPTYGGKMDPVANHIQDFMDENWLRTLNQQQGTKFNTVQEAIDAGLKPGAGLQNMTLDEAHRLRMGMDKVSGKPGWGANPDEVNKSNALNEARNVLASHIEDAADKIGAGAEWKAANQAYKKAADIKKIASVGVSKHAGNNAIPLRTAIMTAGAIPAAGHFLMSGHPGAAVGALSAPALSWLAERYGPAATAHTLNLVGKGASSPLLPQIAAQAPKAVLPTMTGQGEPEPHAEGGEVAASAMPGVNAWLSGIDQNPKEDFVRSQTDAKYRKARGPYTPDVADVVKPRE